MQDEQALLEQNDVGGFLGDIRSGIYRDPHIGGLERRAVVDAIAQYANDMAARA